MTPTELAQKILDDLYCLDWVGDLPLLDTIANAIQEYGEARYSEGFSDGEGAERESQEMMAV